LLAALAGLLLLEHRPAEFVADLLGREAGVRRLGGPARGVHQRNEEGAGNQQNDQAGDDAACPGQRDEGTADYW
jgi:hypothetical protein